MINKGRKRDNPAYPEQEGCSFTSLTKREQAAITILAGLVANQFNCNSTADSLAGRAVDLADNLFDRLEQNK